MLSFLSNNLQRFFVFFFTATSIVLIAMGIMRVKKPVPSIETAAPTPVPQQPIATDTANIATFDGATYQTPWGSAVASITVKNGSIIAVSMPSVPNSPPSIYAEPFLVDQALKAGSANIQGVSGATFTSMAFKSSLESAIAKASTGGQAITPNTNTAVSAPVAKPSVPRRYRDDD